jgi:hypothetical protein
MRLLSMSCPHCAVKVSIFSKGWQSQRRAKVRVCPTCRSEVEVVFAAKRYLPVLGVLLSLSFLLFTHFGMPSRLLGTAIGIPFGLALFPSMYLRKAAPNLRRKDGGDRVSH